MNGGALLRRNEAGRDFYEETTYRELNFPEEDQSDSTKVLIIEKPKKGFLKSKITKREIRIKYVDILEVLLLLNAHLAKGTKSICINYDGIDIATIVNKFSFIGRGSYKIGTTVECDDSSIHLVSFLLTDNKAEDIDHEFQSLITFATNNSPFISQFYYGFDLRSLRFYFKNVIYRIPDLINTKIFPSLKPIWKDIKSRYPIIYEYLSGNTIIDDKYSIATGSLTVEKGDYTLDYIYYSSKRKHSEIIKTRIGFLTFIYNLTIISDLPWAFLCYCLEIFLGFYTLYSKGYIHGDFKYDNVIWKSTKLTINSCEIDTGVIQLIDFGLSSTKQKNWTCGARSHRPFKLLPYKYASNCDGDYDYPNLVHSTIEKEELFDQEYDIYSFSSATIKRLFGINNYDNYCDGHPQISLLSRIIRDHSFNRYSEEIKEMFEFMDNQDEKVRTKLPDAIKTIWEELMKLDFDNQFHPRNLVRKWGNFRGVKKDNFSSVYNSDNFPDYIVEYTRALYP